MKGTTNTSLGAFRPRRRVSAAAASAGAGGTYNETVDCTLTTANNEFGVGAQGWSISLAGDPGLDIVDITVDGTAAADEAEDPHEQQQAAG